MAAGPAQYIGVSNQARVGQSHFALLHFAALPTTHDRATIRGTRPISHPRTHALTHSLTHSTQSPTRLPSLTSSSRDITSHMTDRAHVWELVFKCISFVSRLQKGGGNKRRKKRGGLDKDKNKDAKTKRSALVKQTKIKPYFLYFPSKRQLSLSLPRRLLSSLPPILLPLCVALCRVVLRCVALRCGKGKGKEKIKPICLDRSSQPSTCAGEPQLCGADLWSPILRVSV